MYGKLLSFKTPTILLALCLVTLVPEVSQASWIRSQPIYVRNNTTHTIWVAAQYMPPGSCDFVTSGMWQIAPGQTVFVASNVNRWIYFYARDDAGNVWDGNDTHGTVNGERLGMRQYDTTMCFDPWTITFGG
ncbi:MAG TPA: DUF1036 domain-containing protein [Gemmataceae bacterium]|nr:DUF1036 domain-containing protein [Gemmataceae bacterium]